MTSRFASLSVQDIENVVEERGVKNERRGCSLLFLLFWPLRERPLLAGKTHFVDKIPKIST